MSPEHQPESRGLEKTDKHIAWETKLNEIEHITDGLGMRVDEDIEETVTALNLSGFHTTGSCEGHLDHGTMAPWIDIETSELTTLMEKLNTLKKEGKGNKPESVAVIEEITKKSLFLREKLLQVLDEFYKEHNVNVDSRLIVQGLGWGRSRLESQGSDLQEIRELEERQKKLLGYQQEIKTFTEFLKQRFLNT